MMIIIITLTSKVMPASLASFSSFPRRTASASLLLYESLCRLESLNIIIVIFVIIINIIIIFIMKIIKTILPCG